MIDYIKNAERSSPSFPPLKRPHLRMWPFSLPVSILLQRKSSYTHVQTIKKQLILKVAHINLYKLQREKIGN